MHAAPPDTGKITTAKIVLHPRRLTQVIGATLLAVLISTCAFLSHDNWGTGGLLLALNVPLLVSLWCVRTGRVSTAAALMLVSITVFMGYMAYTSQGIHDETIVAFPGVLMFASLFGTRRLFLGTLAVMTALLCAIAIVNIEGIHVNTLHPVTAASIISLLSILFVIAFFVWIMASDLRHALARLETENERIRESHTRIDDLAHHDALTGLANRLLARGRLETAMQIAQRDGHEVGLIFLDLDNFKAVNDSLGHAAGDLLLCEVAKRLTSIVRPSDTVSRQGGDEFLIVMGGLSNEEAAAATAIRIIDELARPFIINGLEIFITSSIGLSLFPRDGADFDTLMKNADVAMYRSKDAGRNAFRFYDAEMNTSVVETLHLISGIRTALARGEFRLHYQPQYDLRSGVVVGAEALIRWRHPDLGLIPPSKFIPVAERSGLINEVGAWVLNEACRQARAWQDAGLRDVVVAINLSPVQFRRDDIEREVLNALAAAQLSPSSIELELTESLLIADSKHLGPLLRRLRDMGIRFSIDDFGTGYSNLGYLRRFEVERLKIDQSFVRRMTEDVNDESIVRAIIDMAHNLKLETVAEGIEDPATLARLIEMGCQFGQGYHWAPALPPDEFLAYAQKASRAINHQLVLIE